MPAVQLEITVSDQKENTLLGRTEFKVQVRHLGQPTPTRQVLRTEVGRVSKAPPDRVFIRKIVTDYGAGISECIANVYAASAAGEAVEQEYIRTRNAGPQAKKPEVPKEAPPTLEKAPVPAAPEAPAPAKESPVKTIEVEEKPSEPKAEGAEHVAKPKAPKKKPVKEKSEETPPPAPEKKES